MRPAFPMPAQLIRMRATPFSALACLMAASALAESDTSHFTAMPPIVLACAFAASMLTSSSATLAPALASSAAVAAPRPEPPPVTIAACPLMSISVLPCFGVFDQQCDALSAADAGGGNAVAQAAVLQFTRERDGEAHAGGPQRVTDRDRAAIDVEPVLVEAERACAGHHLRTERLVDLETIDVRQFQACALEHGIDRRHRADAHDFGRHARGRTCDQAAERGLGVFPDVIAGSRERRRRAIDDRGGIAAGLHAAEGR